VIHFIVFSRNRPIQLHGLLTSLSNNLHGDASVDVLVLSDPEYVEAYNQIQRDFDSVRFFAQSTSFSEDMQRLTSIPCDYVCFLCDDVLFQRRLDMDDVETMMSDERIVSVSFRLGRHVTHGMFWNQQPQPPFEQVGEFLVWDTNVATGDWNYVFDVLGSIYRFDFVQKMQPHLLNAQNPSQYEDAGSRAWWLVTKQHHYACWAESRTTVPTPNVVQTEFGNGYVGQGELDAEFLLQCWKHNLRMDTERFNRLYETWRISDFHLMRI